MTTYHIATTGNNANNGLSQGSAFRSIQYGHDIMSGGDTLLVYPGAYNEQIALYKNNITVRGTDSVNRPTIWFAEYQDYVVIVRISGQCVFENFEVRDVVQANDANYHYRHTGIDVGGTSSGWNHGHVIIRNCEVHHVGGEAIRVHYQDGLLCENNEFHHAVMLNYDGKTSNNIWDASCSFTRGANYVIRNNRVWDVWGEGLAFDFGVIGIEVEGNVVGRAWSGKIYVGEAQNAQIHGNLVFSPTENEGFSRGPNDGLGLTDESYTPPLMDIDNVSFFNNIAVNCSSGIWIDHGFDEHNTKNVYFYNNTIIALSAGHAAFRMYGSSFENVNVTNNIFYVSSSAAATAGSLSENIRFDRNLWNSPPGSIASSANDINADPKLVNPEAVLHGNGLGIIDAQNYKITASSPAINKGNSNIDVDYFGNARADNPDLGAHEFDGTSTPPIQITFSVGDGEEEGIAPHTVNFDSSGSYAEAGIDSYLWDFGDGTQSTEANPTHEYLTAGSKTVSLTITDTQGNSDTKIIANYINVLPVPSPVIEVKFSIGDGEEEGIVPHTVHFNSSESNATQGIATYLWDFGDGTQSTEADPTYEYTTSGFKTVTLTLTDTQGNSNTLTKENYIVVQSQSGLEPPVVYYQFEEGRSEIVKDLTVGSPPLDLTITDMSAVEWLDRGLKITAPTVLKTAIPAQKIINACQSTNAISIEAWVKPENLTQNGPARIVSISDDIYNRNVTLGQGGAGGTSPADFYIARLRTTDTNENGRPEVETPPGSLKTDLQHVVYTRNSGGHVKIYINNQLVLEELVSGTFNWNPSYALYLANERTGYRSWLGELHMVAIYAAAISAEHVAYNFEHGPHADVNAVFTIGDGEDLGPFPHTVNFDAAASSASHNIVSYVWDFDDGNSGEGIQVSHIYAEKGEYVPSLTIEDELGNKDIVVRAYPIIVLDPEPERIETDLQVLYTFLEGEGDNIKDISSDNPLNLKIDDETAVTWLPAGLRINRPVKITSNETAKKIIDACVATDQITIEAWIQPARENQTGPARIVTISKNLVDRYVTLAQGLWGNQPGNLYDIRLRRDPAKANGTPSFSSEIGSVQTELTHVAFTWDATSGDGKIYLDSTLHATNAMPGSFNTWNSGYYMLNLANEATGGRNWLGDMFLVAIYAKALNAAEVQQNFQAGIPFKPQIPENFRRFVLLHPHYNPEEDTTGLIAYGIQYPDSRCALIWEGDSEFDILPDFEAVIEKYQHTTFHWFDE